MTKHRNNSPVIFVTHKRFCRPLLSSVLLRGLITNKMNETIMTELLYYLPATALYWRWYGCIYWLAEA